MHAGPCSEGGCRVLGTVGYVGCGRVQWVLNLCGGVLMSGEWGCGRDAGHAG